MAKRLCPHAIVVPVRGGRYREVSQRMFAILDRFSPLVEPLSIDEAFLDLTGTERSLGPPEQVAQQLKDCIRTELKLTASVGLAPNKFLAKLASDQRKPDGLFVIPPSAGPGFVLDLPVGRFHGVGPATAAKMERLGLRTGADLRAADEAFLARHFGKAGAHYWRIARGIDHREVRPDRIRKSVGAETTYREDIHDPAAAAAALAPLAEKVWRHVAAQGIRGRTVTLKAKYADFRIVTRARTLPAWVGSEAEMLAVAQGLLGSVLPDPRGVRLLGVTLSGLEHARGEAPDAGQMELFPG